MITVLVTEGCSKSTTVENDTGTDAASDSAKTDSGGELDTDPDTDADTSSDSGVDTGMSDCCLSARIRWGTDCGMGHMDPIFILGRCGDTLDSSDPYICLPTLPTCPNDTLVDASELNTLLTRRDVRDAFEGDLQSYGISTSPYYHISLEFEEGGEIRSLSIGRPCEGADAGADDCVPIPDGVRALKDTLDAIVYNLGDYGLDEGTRCEFHNY